MEIRIPENRAATGLAPCSSSLRPRAVLRTTVAITIATSSERNDDPAVQIEEAKDADILIIANMPLKAEVINACPNLKYIDVAFTGVDHVALDAAKAKGIKVSNASGYSTVAVAELTIAMMLDLLRRVPQVDAACRAGKPGGDEPNVAWPGSHALPSNSV